jgi:hypothetical protein
MRRTLLNLAAFSVIVLGGFYLCAAPADASGPTNTCTSGSGATCTGDKCCADANFCYSTCPIVKIP